MVPAKDTHTLKLNFDTRHSVCLVLNDDVHNPLGDVLIYIIMDPSLLNLIKDLICN